MSYLADRTTIGDDVCRILGISPENVTRLELHFAPDDVPLAMITRHIDERELTEFRELLERCELGKVRPHLTVTCSIGRGGEISTELER
jgi:hypothetical protein